MLEKSSYKKDNKKVFIILVFILLLMIIIGTISIKSTKKTHIKLKKEQNNYSYVTIDGYDKATRTTISKINIWTNYQSRSLAFKANHGESVKMIKRDGDAIYIENKQGKRGWVTYFFIKEMK